MTPTNSQCPCGTGIVIGDLGFCAIQYGLNGQPPKIVESHPTAPPPSVILPRFAGEPLTLDCAISARLRPVHPRGSGCAWPPESRVDDKHGAGRYPLTLAWADLPDGRKWTWDIDENPHEVAPAEAIAAAAAHILQVRPSLVGDVGGGLPALVIPNCTRESDQQALLDAANGLGVSMQLLWRPVAAALAWCDQFQEFLREISSTPAGRNGESVGHLLCLHLGLTTAEATVLELVVREQAGEVWVIPARHRPDAKKDTTTSPGWLALRTRANKLLSAAKLPTDDREQFWQLMFSTNWANAALYATDGPGGDTPTTVEMPTGRQLPLVRPSPSILDNLPWIFSARPRNLLGLRCLPEIHLDMLDTWLLELAKTLPEKTLGAVVTGEMASVPRRDGQPMARFATQCLRIPDDRVLLEPSAATGRLLAQGAAIFSARRKAELPTYLDTLPQLQLLIRRFSGEMDWEPLLKAGHEYVDGGREWQRFEPVSGLAIEKNSPRLTFAIYHEEFPSIRELLVDLPRTSKIEEPVKLHVSITPAQGNARLEVCPKRGDLFGTHRILVDWSRMVIVPDEKGGHDRQAYIDHQPHPYPEFMPRLHSCRTWRSAKGVIREFLDADRSAQAHRVDAMIKDLKNALQRPDQQEQRVCGSEVRAVSSDGRVDEEQELLDRLIDRLWTRLRCDPYAQQASHIVRCLAYASADCPGYAEFLINGLDDIMVGVPSTRIGTPHAQRSFKQAILLGCGLCLRSPEHTRILAPIYTSTNTRGWGTSR